jgi:hypothetical protein
MKTRNLIPHIPMVIAAAAIAVLTESACAAAATAFNPDGLDEARISQVEAVCENVMGLSPSERLIGGDWLGDSRLDYWTSRYRGCVTSLSDSVRTISEGQANEQADRDCRAKGYTTGSPDLALCVLQTAHETRSGTPVQAPTQQTSVPLPTAHGSLFYASGSERHQREETACAAVGIEPTGGAFGACVNDLQRTFHAIDTPIT